MRNTTCFLGEFINSKSDSVERGMREAKEAEQRNKWELTYSVLFEILKSRRRRLVLELFEDVGQSNLGEFSILVASQELNKGVDRVTSAERKKSTSAYTSATSQKWREWASYR